MDEDGRTRSRIVPRLPAGRTRTLLLALSLLFACLLSPAPGISATRTLRVGLYENMPKIFTLSGKPAGIFPDLLEAIAAKEGWRIVYVPGTWQEGLGRLDRGEIDLMPDVAFSSKRGERYLFPSEPVLSDWFQLYTRKGSGIRSILTLQGKRVALLARSIQEDSLRTLVREFGLTVHTLPFPNYDQAFRAVSEGRADAVLTNRFFGERNMRKYGLEETAVIFHPTHVYFALPRSGDPAIGAALDARLREFKGDPDSIYFRTLRKWTAADETPPIPLWLKEVAAALLVLALIGLSASLLLKRQVRRQRKELQRSGRALERAYENWRATFKAVQDAIWVLDAEENVLVANPATLRVLGFGPERASGRAWAEIRRELFEGLDDAPLRVARAERRRETSLFARGDRWLWWAVDPILEEEDAFGGFILLFSDVTDLKRAEEESEEKSRRIGAINEALEEKVAELRNALRQTVRVLVNASGLRDPYTAGHQRRVAGLARAIAEEMGYDPERVRQVELAALVHDIGKIEIPAEILAKPRKLNPIEYQLVQTHPAAASRILESVPLAWPLAEIVLQHHERMDGTGYPQGLTGEEILPEARVIAVADTVEAMSSHRPYRPALGLEAALEEIVRRRGSGFDPEAVDACLRLFRERGFTFEEGEANLD